MNKNLTVILLQLTSSQGKYPHTMTIKSWRISIPVFQNESIQGIKNDK